MKINFKVNRLFVHQTIFFTEAAALLAFFACTPADPSHSSSHEYSNSEYCSARLEGDTLILENSFIARRFLWNDGNIKTWSVEDKTSKRIWRCGALRPDMSFPGTDEKGQKGTFIVEKIPGGSISFEHLRATVCCTVGTVEVRRVFRLYPQCPAIACDLYLRGKANISWVQTESNPSELQNVEKQMKEAGEGKIPVIEKLDLPGRHWKINAVEFHDVTDRFNNLVRENSGISYSRTVFRGNLLFATNMISGNGIFMLKEAPTSNAQLAYPGNDYLTEFGTIKMLGAGMNNSDLDPERWTRAYGFVTGVWEGDETNRLIALRNYLQRIRIHQPGRDEMIMMNTWGDRAQDTRVNEKFALAELEAGAKLGITHFQLDDGWQSGRSGNSAFQGGSFTDIWKNPDYWMPDPVKFPHGLTPVVEKGKQLGIDICLWFNPSPDNHNGNWEKDAGALIRLYREYDIRTFKIDGVKMPDKESEVNFRRMLDKVAAATNNEVVFNMDVTAGKRGGYFYFNEYGNIFLENRYTDWKNYYPWWTLRNVWMLSKYIPPQNLQIEFLNKWRNQDKYGDDPFAPGNYRFDYLFAITMPAQPLAWFEGTGLPEEAFLSASVIKKYRKIQADFHSGYILPVGDEPSGSGWTGFQSFKAGSDEGYILIFRERNNTTEKGIRMHKLFPGKYRFEKIIGEGGSFTSNIRENLVTFSLPEMNSYTLYKYSMKK
jgi:alpha-galactosidase